MAPDIYTPFRRSNFKLIGEFGKKKNHKNSQVNHPISKKKRRCVFMREF